VVILEAIKLLEAGRRVTLCDEVWVGTSSEAAQLRRLHETRQMDEAEARRRMAAQSSQEEKSKHADRIIHNDGTVDELYSQLDRAWMDVLQKVAANKDEVLDK